MQQVISNHKLLKYFGITDLTQQESALFFIYIQAKLSKIYNLSTFKALPSPLNLQKIRNQHVAHISTLFTGGADNNFLENSHKIWRAYQELGVSHGEYIKLYQLMISYITSEAHKKYWYRYKKYRKVSRAIRNLLMFDLAIGISFTTPINNSHRLIGENKHDQSETIQLTPRINSIESEDQKRLFENAATQTNESAKETLELIDSKIEAISNKINSSKRKKNNQKKENRNATAP